MVGTVELVTLIIDGVIGGIDAFRKVMNDLQQQGELTPEQSAALTARMETAFASSSWQTDDQRAEAQAKREAGAGPTDPEPAAPLEPPDTVTGGDAGGNA